MELIEYLAYKFKYRFVLYGYLKWKINKLVYEIIEMHACLYLFNSTLKNNEVC